MRINIDALYRTSIALFEQVKRLKIVTMEKQAIGHLI